VTHTFQTLKSRLTQGLTFLLRISWWLCHFQNKADTHIAASRKKNHETESPALYRHMSCRTPCTSTNSCFRGGGGRF